MTLAKDDRVDVFDALADPTRRRLLLLLRTDERSVEVSVVAAAGVALPDVAAQVRSALAPSVGRRTIDVHIADVALPEAGPAPSVGQDPGDHLG